MARRMLRKIGERKKMKGVVQGYGVNIAHFHDQRKQRGQRLVARPDDRSMGLIEGAQDVETATG